MSKALLILPPIMLLAACSGMSGTSGMSTGTMPMPSDAARMQSGVPADVRVPTGHRVTMETVGVGEITYQCREKAGAAGQYEWVFVGPKAVLNDRQGRAVGSYYGPPATWESRDGSKVTATQVAVAPGGAGNIPFQLVRANPAMGQGAMTGVSYIQRLATRGGVAPAAPCAMASAGQQQVVQYQADYLFWTGM